MKKYLICHFWCKDEQGHKTSGFGNVDIEMEPGEDIYTPEGVDAVVEFLKNKNNFTGCVILNIIPLNS